MAMTLETETRPDVRPGVRIEDVEYQRQGGRALLARLYRPAGTGPYPAVVQVHGGAWVNKDRTDNDFIARALAESGILVASIDFRMPPEAPYPASLADINLGVRWLKARARALRQPPRLGRQHRHLERRPSGAARGDAPRRSALCRAAARPRRRRSTPASRFVISGWGVLDPLLRYHLAKKAGNAELVENHHAFWGDEAAMSEGSPPAILDRGEKVALPPALVFGGDKDEWVPLDTMHRLVNGWKKAGGEIELQLYPGAGHGFMTGKPDAPYARPAIERMKAFIRKHTG